MRTSLPIRSVFAALLGALSFTASGLAAAAPVTFAFAGTVIEDPLLDPSDPFGGAIANGTAFSGTYTFASDASNSSADSGSGSYVSSGPPFGFAVNIGGQDFTQSGVTITTAHGGGLDFYGVLAESGIDSITLSLTDLTGTALGGVALPLLAPDLPKFADRRFFLSYADIDGNQVQIVGAIDALRCVSGCEEPPPSDVPEPGIAALLAMCALVEPLCRRGRQ